MKLKEEFHNEGKMKKTSTYSLTSNLIEQVKATTKMPDDRQAPKESARENVSSVEESFSER